MEPAAVCLLTVARSLLAKNSAEDQVSWTRAKDIETQGTADDIDTYGMMKLCMYAWNRMSNAARSNQIRRA